MDLKETIALVTGGASGIGEACVREIVRMGGRSVILDLQEDKGKMLAAELKEGNVIFIKTDVTSDDDVKAAVELAVTTFGKINVVINCAGIGGPRKIISKEAAMTTEFFNSRIQVNLIGSMRLIIFASQKMAENEPNTEGERGVIINTSSVAATQGQIGQAAYAASKGGINGLMLPVARELGRYGIRVMTIAPGVVDTPMFANVPEKARQALEQSIPFPKRLGRPSEYAKLAAHIIENPYLNGEVYHLTGAMRMA